MARGQQKIQAQQKNAAKKAAANKKGSTKESAQAAYKYTCDVCKIHLTGPKVYKEHFTAKHPKAPLPKELEGV